MGLALRVFHQYTQTAFAVINPAIIDTYFELHIIMGLALHAYDQILTYQDT
jgi:hypothetical protein